MRASAYLRVVAPGTRAGLSVCDDANDGQSSLSVARLAGPPELGSPRPGAGPSSVLRSPRQPSDALGCRFQMLSGLRGRSDLAKLAAREPRVTTDPRRPVRVHVAARSDVAGSSVDGASRTPHRPAWCALPTRSSGGGRPRDHARRRARPCARRRMVRTVRSGCRSARRAQPDLALDLSHGSIAQARSRSPKQEPELGDLR
jgi:hypothetical protein